MRVVTAFVPEDAAASAALSVAPGGRTADEAVLQLALVKLKDAGAPVRWDSDKLLLPDHGVLAHWMDLQRGGVVYEWTDLDPSKAEPPKPGMICKGCDRGVVFRPSGYCPPCFHQHKHG